MTMAASNYVEAIRYHVVPCRMSISDLSLQSHDADTPPPSSTQELSPPLDYQPIGNITFQFPVDVQSPPSDLIPRPTLHTTSAVSSSDLSPKAHGIPSHFAPSPNKSPTDSTYADEEHVSRAKLLELTTTKAFKYLIVVLEMEVVSH